MTTAAATMKTQTREPFFITPQKLSDMSDDELEVMLVAIRERRLRAAQEFKEKERMRQEARDEKTKNKVEKQFAMLHKEIVQADKIAEKLEKRIINIRALRIELGVDL